MEASSQRTRSLHSFMHPSAVGLCDKVLPLFLFQTGGRQQVNVRASLPDYILSAFLIFAGSTLLLLDGFLNHVRRHSSSHCPLKQSLSSSTGRFSLMLFPLIQDFCSSHSTEPNFGCSLQKFQDSPQNYWKWSCWRRWAECNQHPA